jgi:hypothetical protein
VPVGYLVSVGLVALGTLFALVPPRSLGKLSFRLGLLLSEVPIAGFYWLLIWTSLAFVQGDSNSVGGWATVGLAALTTAGLAAVAWRGQQARPALERAMAEALGADWRTAIDPELAARLRRHLPLARILLLPLSGTSPTGCAASRPIRSSTPSFPAPSTPSTCSIPSASRWSSTPSKPSPHGYARARSGQITIYSRSARPGARPGIRAAMAALSPMGYGLGAADGSRAIA